MYISRLKESLAVYSSFELNFLLFGTRMHLVGLLSANNLQNKIYLVYEWTAQMINTEGNYRKH